MPPIHKEIEKTPWVKIEDKKLYLTDKKLIETGGWLTDDIIAATSLILKRMYPEMGGLQSPIFGESLSFDVCKGEICSGSECWTEPLDFCLFKRYDDITYFIYFCLL